MADESGKSAPDDNGARAGGELSASRDPAPANRPGRSDPELPAEKGGVQEPAMPNGGHDAVCFTAGFSGATFGAGTIHAYLAADRDPPGIAAGISMGAVSAAALQRCYKELEGFPRGSVTAAPPADANGRRDHREAARWAWFRRYLSFLSERPFDVIWKALPNQSDFYADLPPVRDTTVRKFPDEATREEWTERERLSRRELYLLVKFGNWLATLPLRFSRIADYLVTYVRVKEKNPEKRFQSWFKYRFLNWLTLFFPVLWHICFAPQWFPERRFLRRRHLKEKYGSVFGRVAVSAQYARHFSRPLFGYRVFSGAWLLLLFLLAIPAGLALEAGYHAKPAWVHSVYTLAVAALQAIKILPRGFDLLSLNQAATAWVSGILRAVHSLNHGGFDWVARAFSWGYRGWFSGLLTTAALVYLVWLSFHFGIKRRTKWFVSRNLLQHFLRKLELERALANDFYLRYRLTQLFGENGRSPLLDSSPMPILLVAAPLQVLRQNDRPIYAAQVWARANGPVGLRLVDALATTLAAPGLYRPTPLRSQSEMEGWVRHDLPEKLDLVDGNFVRQNPIPSLFTYLKEGNGALAGELSSDPDHPRLHVVYNVPVGSASEGAPARPLGVDIVGVVRLSLRLNKRRDTNLEVEQTNFISRLEHELRALGQGPSGRAYPIFADEIAPETEIKFENNLDPRPDEVLTQAANGCRRTLETLYRRELEAWPGAGASVGCSEFLAQIAPARGPLNPQVPGVPEVCARCSRRLARPSPRRPFPPVDGLAKAFPMLAGLEPRIIFVASGGVFRGPFHAGMLACLLATQIRPDMIIGASVGTLMGGALGALLSLRASGDQSGYRRAITLLGELLEVFLHVDRDVAFTKTLKNAAREMGLRGRGFRLSPNGIRRLIRRGSRHDPGFASTGAPSALIDALSDLLLIPHETTAKIAAKFVAGRVSESTRLLVDALKERTLRRLDIESAVFGVSLLEPAARRLLGGQYGIRLDRAQPFLETITDPTTGEEKLHGIAFFATTTNLLNESLFLLGRDTVPGAARYDFVQAALASSAFPGVFSPRKESEIFPGAGSSDVFFSDGGMFDNLPFIPALRLLGAVQRDFRQTHGRDCIDYLDQRLARPDLFIAGSLDVRPEQTEDADGPFDDLVSIRSRAGSLADNVKIRAFEGSSSIVGEQLCHFRRHARPGWRGTGPGFEAFVDGIVDPVVLPVFPSSRGHLNPTFGFCKSTGFRVERVRRSIAEGCFQTFAALADAQDNYPPDDPPQAAESVHRLQELGRVPRIQWVAKSEKPAKGKFSCPWFRHSADEEPSQEGQRLVTEEKERDFTCPFAAIPDKKGPDGRRVFEACRSDSAHFREAQKRRAHVSRIGQLAASLRPVVRRITPFAG